MATSGSYRLLQLRFNKCEVKREKKAIEINNLTHDAFPPWSKAFFHPLTQSCSLQDATQHIPHSKKRKENSRSESEWAQNGQQALSLSDFTVDIHPSRQSSHKGLLLFEMSQYGMSKPQIKLHKNDRGSVEWEEWCKVFQNGDTAIKYVVVQWLSYIVYLVINVTCIMSCNW